MTCSEFESILTDEDRREQYQIIDVREDAEIAMSSFKQQSHIKQLPISTSDKWTVEIKEGKLLDALKPTICVCKAGIRSMNAAAFLGKTSTNFISRE